MPKLILVTGATGNQGGSVAKLLLQHPTAYTVRALTRTAASAAALSLAAHGVEIIQGDLTIPSTLAAAVKGCWGVFGVTNFYDAKIKDDPSSEEAQGRNLVAAASQAGVQCFLWSTLPSSRAVSGGRLVSQIYEGKHHVDAYIREVGLPACFLYTGSFYENMIARKHVSYDRESNVVEFKHPIIREDTKLAMLYVQKDLCAVAKAAFDHWEEKKETLNHQYLYVMNARISYGEVRDCIQRVTGKKCTYTILPTTNVPDRDIMFDLYNEQGMYRGKEIPDPNVLELGVKFHDIEDFVREDLVPYLSL